MSVAAEVSVRPVITDKLELVGKECRSPCLIPAVISWPHWSWPGPRGHEGVVYWLNVGSSTILLGCDP